jgi:predicted porin
MNMKKSAIAVAVTGAIAAPMSASAAEAYGSINTTLETSSADGGGNSAIFNTTTDNGGFGMSDTWESRFGFTGGEDLGGGLEANYKFEFGLGTSSGDTNGGDNSGDDGSVNEDANINTRLSWAALSGGFGEVKLGTMWGVLYEYAGWNHYRTDGHGGATHYYMTSSAVGPFTTSDDPSALRSDNTIKYTYGGGGYSSDPFTFSLQVRSKDDSDDANDDGDFTDAGDTNDDEGIDNITLGAQGTFGPVTVNGTYYQEQNTGDAAEPSLLTLGARGNIGPVYLGGTFFSGDKDDDSDSDSPSALNVLAGMDFGGGTSGHLGLGTGDADNDDSEGDLSTFFLQAEHKLSSRTKVYGEYESATIDGGSGDDADQSVFAVGVKHSF